MNNLRFKILAFSVAIVCLRLSSDIVAYSIGWYTLGEMREVLVVVVFLTSDWFYLLFNPFPGAWCFSQYGWCICCCSTLWLCHVSILASVYFQHFCCYVWSCFHFYFIALLYCIIYIRYVHYIHIISHYIISACFHFSALSFFYSHDKVATYD